MRPLLSRPAFYVIVLLIGMMVMLTLWLQWKLETLPRQKEPKETPPAAVSDGP